MPEQPTTILAILNGTAALVGAYVSVRAYRAYRRSEVRFLFLLTLGFATLTTALVVEGFVFEVLGWPLATAHVVEASFNLAAFVILAWSLHASGPTRSEQLEPQGEAGEEPGAGGGARDPPEGTD